MQLSDKIALTNDHFTEYNIFVSRYSHKTKKNSLQLQN